jgi:intracellular sulfur oxidation DsrE/DsrF family protein
MRKLLLLTIAGLICFAGFSQNYNSDSSLRVLKIRKDSTLNALKVQRDSTFRATMHADSVKVNKEFADKEKWEKVKGLAVFPVLNAGEMSGIIPVKDPTEIPDPKMEYKLLFEVTRNNPDSVAKDINFSLVEIARVINLHVASGIPLKNIKPVIVVHAEALKAISTNVYYKEQYKLDNPNLKIFNELKNLGAKFIACGQAMTFFEVKKEDLLPDVKVSLTAQTVLSSYQLKGYVLFWP